MKKVPKPALIGAFVVGAALIAVLGIGVLASGAFFRESASFVSYFEESVDGLDVGAPVKFNGIKIGEVTDIGIFAMPDPPRRYASVAYDIDLGYIRSLGIESDFTDPKVVRQQVDQGMRVRLELASIVTGVVFLELEFEDEVPEPVFVRERPPFPEIPTKRSALAELGQSATEVIARLSAVDAPAIGAQLTAVLKTVDTTLVGVNLRAVSEEMLVAVREFRQTLEAADVAASTAKLHATLDEYHEVALLLNDRLVPTLARVDSATQKLELTLSILENAAGDVSEVFRENSDLITSIEEAAAANKRAMVAMRELAEMLERNPRALLTGKPDTRN